MNSRLAANSHRAQSSATSLLTTVFRGMVRTSCSGSVRVCRSVRSWLCIILNFPSLSYLGTLVGSIAVSAWESILRSEDHLSPILGRSCLGSSWRGSCPYHQP